MAMNKDVVNAAIRETLKMEKTGSKAAALVAERKKTGTLSKANGEQGNIYHQTKVRAESEEVQKKQRNLAKAINELLGGEKVSSGQSAAIAQAKQQEEQAKREYDAYMASEQRKKDALSAGENALGRLSLNAGSSLDLQLNALPGQGINPVEQGYKATADYYEQQRKATEDNALMEADLAELESWTESDRKALAEYALGRYGEYFGPTELSGRNEAAAQNLIAKYGRDTVNAMAESWMRNQNAKAGETVTQAAREGAGKGFGGAVGHSVGSIFANAANTLTAPLGYLQEGFTRTGRYQTLDPNNAGALPGQYASAVRTEVSENIEEGNGFLGKVGSTVYQAGMSTADNLTRIAMGGGTKIGSLGLAAVGSFGSTMQQASAQGATPAQAVGMGLADAFIEVGTEYIPLDNLLKVGKSGVRNAGQAVLEALKQAGIEATTEEIGYLGSLVAEAAILREKSGYNQQIGELVANGLSYDQAKAQVDQGIWNEAVRTFNTSFLSGGMMSGAQSAGQYLAGKMGQIRQGNADANKAVPAETAPEDTAPEAVIPEATKTAAEPKKPPERTPEEKTNEAIRETLKMEETKAAPKPEGKAKTEKEKINEAIREALGMEGAKPESEPKTDKDTAIRVTPTTEETGGGEEGEMDWLEFFRELDQEPEARGKNKIMSLFSKGKPGNTNANTSGESVNDRVDTEDGDLLLEGSYEAAAPIDSKIGSIPTPESVPVDSFTPEATGETAPESNMPNNRPDGNGEKSNFENMVAANRGFSPFSRMQYEYGNIPEGENPVRPDDMPVSTNGTDRVSYTARTVKGARVTPDEFVPLLEQNVTRGGFSFIPITNDETVQGAMGTIQQEGWNVAYANWVAAVRQGRTGADIAAMGALLYNHAVNSGEYQDAMDILTDYQAAVRNSARGLQAARILKTLTPDNRLYMIRRSVQRMVEDMGTGREIEIDEDLARQYQQAEDDAEADRILDQIIDDVAKQIPPTLGEAFTALRYVNMLGNFRTQIRNLSGNIASKGVYLVKDKIAATLETAAQIATGGRFQRSKVYFTDRATRRAARADFENVRDWLLDGGRYNDTGNESDEFARRVQERRRMLPIILEQYRQATNWAMNNEYFGDAAFGRGAYARALAGYLNARGIRTDNLETVDPRLLNQAREYAVRQAQEATFRDNNRASDFVSGILRGRNTPAWVRAVGEGVMPFRKTPANVLVRAEEFSPLGIINSLVATVRGARGQITGAEVIDSWAKSLTGTGLFFLGMALADMGYLVGGPDPDEEKAEFDELNGYQNYAIQLPDGTNLTIDFLSPMAMPLFLGAQMNAIREAETDLEWDDLESVFLSLSDPMIEMSMLQGVNDTIDAIRYADNSGGQFLLNAITSYLMQGLTNTMLGQMERGTEQSRMTTYIDKDSPVPVWLQRQLGKISQKFPGWDFQQTEYRDAWGRTQDNPEGIKNWLYQMLSPAYIDRAKVDETARELYRLNEAQSDVNVFPQSPENALTYTDKDGNRHENYHLNQEQFQKLQQTEGRTQARIVAELTQNIDYAALTDSQKAKAVSLAYAYAREAARVETIGDYGGYSDSWMQGIDGKEAAAIIGKVATADFTDAMNALTECWREEYDDSGARAALETAFTVFSGLSPATQIKIAANASGRMGDYITLKNKGMDTETFIDLYQAYWDIDQSGKSDSEKAMDWAYTVEKAWENRIITDAQKDALRKEMVFYQSFQAETEKFDQLTENGISADDAQDLGWLMQGLKPQSGYTSVRPVQKAETIANSSLSEDDKIAALKVYGTDAQDENLDQMLSMGFDAADYVSAWLIYAEEDAKGGRGTKDRTIRAFMELFGVDRATATAIYEIYG